MLNKMKLIILNIIIAVVGVVMYLLLIPHTTTEKYISETKATAPLPLYKCR